jgi:hypothetical protein
VPSFRARRPSFCAPRRGPPRPGARPSF